jgi:hypothetical protein
MLLYVYKITDHTYFYVTYWVASNNEFIIF